MIRRSRKAWQMQISEAELSGLTRELDAAHREAMPHMQAEAASFGANLREQIHSAGLHRRGFLLGVGALGVGVALAGCGGDNKDSAQPAAVDSAAPAAAGGRYTGDLKIVAFAAALENQAVGAYQAALDAAGKGALGTVPPAVGVFAQTAMMQHAEHAKAWNGVLTGAGLPAVTGVPLSDHQKTMDALGAVQDVGDVAKLALSLEDQAARTYLFAIGGVSDAGGIKTAATIAPVEAMHAAILNFVLGQYPVPDAFLSTTGAADPATFTG
jgi:hypothetical protein